VTLSALPAPRTPDPMLAPPLRWGVLGTGWIAQRFCASLQSHTRQEVRAVGSRSAGSAEAFARSLGGTVPPVAHASYEALVADPDVDVVYVATPHNLHHPHARLAIEAGKHVVVEKPMGLDADECRDLSERAKGAGVFLMEALWSLFLPKYDVLRQLLEAGVLGEVHSVVADMGEHFAPDHRIMRADLAGGPLNDLGTYPVMFATWVLGPPSAVVALATTAPASLSADRVTGQVSAVLRTADGGMASLHTSVLGASPTAATVVGSLATLTIDGPFYQPGSFTLTPVDGAPLRWEEPAVAHDALHYEAAEAARCITAGRLESSLRTVADTVTTMSAMDAIRASLADTAPH
jgi:predicted dehydrogenase